METDSNYWDVLYRHTPLPYTGTDPHLIDYSEMLAGTRILDLGAGTGREAKYLLANGCSVHAVDYSPEALNILREENPDLPLTVELADLSAGWTPSEPFDHVVALFVLHFLPQEAALRLLSVLRERTGSGGLHFLSSFCLRNALGTDAGFWARAYREAEWEVMLQRDGDAKIEVDTDQGMQSAFYVIAKRP